MYLLTALIGWTALANLTAQEASWKVITITLEETTGSKREILHKVEALSGLSFAYPGQLLHGQAQSITVNWQHESLEQVLRSLFEGRQLVITQMGNSLLIRPEPQRPVYYHLHGYVTDAGSGEPLIGATLNLQTAEGSGTSTNLQGYYTLSLPPGNYQLQISYLGYGRQEQNLRLTKDQRLDLSLVANAESLQEVIVLGRSEDQPQPAAGGSQHRIDIETMKTLPAMGGEADILKTVQLLPGVNQAGEGSSGLYVRGGNLDQNLILLDDAPIYHASHLLGFFSTFHPDAIRYADLYTGNFPVQYGGRLSSVLNLRMKEGNREKLGVQGGLGLLASRLLVEGPLVKGKHSFMLAGRRTYPDLLLGLFSPDEGGNKANFYDLNAKFNLQISPNDRLYFSAYHGRDRFRFFDAYENHWGNTTATVRWHRIFSERLFGNLSAIFSRYRYLIDNLVDMESISSWESGVQDLNLKANFTYALPGNNRLYFGMENILHRFEPGRDRLRQFGSIPTSKTLEQAIYIGHHWERDRWTLDYGLRLNANHNLGRASRYNFNDQFQLVDTLHYGPGIYHSKINPAPRISLTFRPDERHRLQLGYSRTVQYLQELRNSPTGFNAFYTFLPSTPNLPEQKADLISVEVARSFRNPALEASLAIYFKKLYHQIDFAPHSQLLQNPLVEGDIRIGSGRAYGLEIVLQKNTGRLTGALNYTYSRSFRRIAGINNDKRFPTYYDQPHNLKLQLQYAAGKRWQLAGNWQYRSGGATTLPIGSYQYHGTVVPIYSERNAERLPDFHRLDLSATLFGKERAGRSYRSFWVFSVYNAYYHKNTLSIDILPRQEAGSGNVPDPTDVAAYRTYLLAIIPSVAYHFKF